MKKTFKLLSIMLIALVGITAWSCDDDDNNDKIINPDQLPVAAKTFLDNYYNGVKITYVDYDKKDKDYDVLLENGHEVTFNLEGEWIDVDAPMGQAVPSEIIPAPIAEYLNLNYPLINVNEISRNTRGYELDLSTGVDLYFDLQGNFLRAENN